MPPRKKSTQKKKEPVKKRKFFTYSLQQVQNALDAIHSGTPVSLASKMFDVPRTTLRRKIESSVPETSLGHTGPPPVLGSYVEEKLSTWLIETSRMGFPIDKACLLYSVKQIVDTENVLTPFKDNLPGRKWFESFMKRHPHLSQKKAEYLSKTRAAVTENSIRNWFANMETMLGVNMQVLQYPRRIFNMDETAVFRAPKGGFVLGEKGKALYDVSSASDKEAITTLFVVNAAGEIAPPLTLYKYVRLPKNCIEAAPPGWGLGKTENGWMDSASFYEYITNVFHPYLLEQKIPLPVIVFLDGHVSHLSYHLSNFCRENDIIVCCLPPNTTHIMQPLDVAFFAPLKQQWKKFVKFWRLQHDGMDIQKFEVPTALSQIINKEKFAETIKAGFRTCGLYPFNPNAVDYTKCVQQKPVVTNEEDNIVEDTIHEPSSHLSYLENKIPTNVLKQFKNTFATNSPWTGDVQFAGLYDTWFQMRNELNGRVLQEISNLQDDNTHNAVFQASKLDATNLDTFQFDFPKFQAVLDGCETIDLSVVEGDIHFHIDRVDENETNVLDSAHNTINPSCSTTSMDIPQKTSRLMNDVPNPIALESSSEQKSCNSLTSVDSTSVDSSITMKKSVDEVLSKILTYPDPKPSKKRQYKREQLPSVITSDKWMEIMAIKENEKRIKIEKLNEKKRRVTKKVTEADREKQEKEGKKTRKTTTKKSSTRNIAKSKSTKKKISE